MKTVYVNINCAKDNYLKGLRKESINLTCIFISQSLWKLYENRLTGCTSLIEEILRRMSVNPSIINQSKN